LFFELIELWYKCVKCLSGIVLMPANYDFYKEIRSQFLAAFCHVIPDLWQVTKAGTGTTLASTTL